MTAAAPAPGLHLHALGCTRDLRVLFEDVSLHVPPGTVCELRGANGSGKSTLLRILAGLHVEHAGRFALAVDAVAPHWREPLLYMGHRQGVSGALTALENLAWFDGLSLAPGDPAGRWSDLARVGLAGYEDVPVQTLSAGQQRRVGLARLVRAAAWLWLLDEPLTALDDAGARLVADLLQEHRSRGGAAIVATHGGLGLADVLRIDLGGGQARVSRDGVPA